MNMWETIQTALEGEGIKTYPPGAKTDECKSKYVVLKESGSARVGNFTSEYVYYDFMLYVPKNKYNTLDDFEKEVKDAINKTVYPTIIPMGSNDSDFYDDEIKAHMRSFMYRNVRRNAYLR